jgi:hypothetical protein
MGFWGDAFKAVLTIVIAITMPELLVLLPLIMDAINAMGIDEKGTPEEIGDKMLQAEDDGIIPENYKTYEEYNKAIEGFELDPEKSARSTEREKLDRYAATHLTALNNRYGEGALEYVIDVAGKQSKDFNSEGRVKTYLDSFGEKISDLNSYFNGTQSDDEMKNTEKKLVEIEKSQNPEKSDLDIKKELSKERTNVQDYGDPA